MKGLYFRFGWAGFGPDPQNDLFVRGFRLGLVTIFVCKTCLVDRIARMRAALNRGVGDIEQRRRETDQA